jgi:nicotinate dehydrogenase subunit A
MIVTIEALLRRCPEPTEAQLRSELQHNLCRCGTHVEILQAARRAVELHRQVRAVDAAPGPCAPGACAASPDS